MLKLRSRLGDPNVNCAQYYTVIFVFLLCISQCFSSSSFSPCNLLKVVQSGEWKNQRPGFQYICQSKSVQQNTQDPFRCLGISPKLKLSVHSSSVWCSFFKHCPSQCIIFESFKQSFFLRGSGRFTGQACHSYWKDINCPVESARSPLVGQNFVLLCPHSSFKSFLLRCFQKGIRFKLLRVRITKRTIFF